MLNDERIIIFNKKNRLNAFSPEIDFRTIKHRVSSADDIINAFADVNLLILVGKQPLQITMHTKVVENWERDPSCKICGVKG